MLVKGQKIKVKINKRNKEFYGLKGYNVDKKEIMVNAEDLSIGSHSKVDVICDYCFSVIKVAWKDYKNYKHNKYSCNKCRQKKVSELNISERRNLWISRINDFCKEKGYTIISDINDKTSIEDIIQYACPNHGIKNTKIKHLMYKHGCEECKKQEQKLSVEEVKRRFDLLGVQCLNCEDYIGLKTKNLKVVCKECKSTFVTSLNSFLSLSDGQVCPDCSKSESRGERKIRHYLECNNIKFKQEKTFDDCRDKNVMPFDFYLLDYNKIIEFDGMQHYKSYYNEESFLSTQKHDAIKNKYCEDNNIKLLRIPYYRYEEIDNILDNYLHEDIV